MELSIKSFTKRSFSTVLVTHPGEEDLIFSATGYVNTKPGAIREDLESEFGQKVDLFEEVNEFMASMPQTQQLALYECYARAYSAYSAFGGLGQQAKFSKDELDDVLADITMAIYDIVDLADLRTYIVGNRKIKLPLELWDEYTTNDKITPLYKERTYRKSEYIDLVANAMGYRFMVPIWGTYLPIAAKEYSPSMKEYYGYKLLDKSKLYTAQSMIRLETYIRANLVEGDYELSVVFKFLDSGEVPVYLMALAIIRKLSIAPLSAENDKDHLMKIVYNYVCGNNNRMPSAFGNNIKPKTDNEGLTDDNGSVWCIYKMKEQISAGDLAMIQTYITNYEVAAQAIESNAVQEKVVLCVLRATNLQDFDPTPAQVTLCIWVMSTIIAGCAVEMFDRKTLMVALGLAQASLWEWGFDQLAVLITASAIPLEEGELLPPIPRTKISAENRDRLNVINPYLLPESKRSEAIMSTNSGVRGVEEVATELFRNDWEPRCHETLAASYYRSDITRRIEVSADIRDQIAEFLIKLDSL